MKPSQFDSFPWKSIFNKSEYETIMRNALIITKRLGDDWGILTKEKYEEERKKYGNYSSRESDYLEKILPYLESAEKLADFCPSYKSIYEENLTI